MLFGLGFIFLFTVGGLNILVPPLNATVCWNILIIVILGLALTSVTKHSLGLSAGNLQIVGSSETTCSSRLLWEDIVRVIKYPLSPKHIPAPNTAALLYSSFMAYSTQAEGNTTVKDNLSYEKVYSSLKEDRAQILRDLNGKSGVYRLVNNINGHDYVGSSINVSNRMRNYLNNAFLSRSNNRNMPITKALLKYGQANFSLYLLEYATDNLTTRETFYLMKLTPYYNVLKEGYSSIGYKHTHEVKKLLSELANNRVHSEKTKALISKVVTGENNPFYNKQHSVETKTRISESRSAYPVYVYNSYKKLLAIYPSVKTLARLVKSNHSKLVSNIKEQALYRGE